MALQIDTSESKRGSDSVQNGLADSGSYQVGDSEITSESGFPSFVLRNSRQIGC